MSQFGKFIKWSRENAGLSQEKLAEKMSVSLTAVQKWESGKSIIRMEKVSDLACILNIHEDTILREMRSEADKKRKNNFPDFLFDDRTNYIVSTIHLNLMQQELFGLLCIYQEGFLEQKNNYEMEISLKDIPYQYISKVGSIQYMNMADELEHVLRYVRPEFLLKILRQHPESEFDVLKLSKDQICEYIDSGSFQSYGNALWEWVGGSEDDPWESFEFSIKMNKAKKILPKFPENGILLTDELPPNPCVGDMVLRKDLPREFYQCDDGVKIEYVCQLRYGLETVTSLEIDNTQRAVWKINEKGKKLCQWFQRKEKNNE